MRSILSRFTLYSVAALALSGLIAGCSGGTSSSLPGAPGVGGPANQGIKIGKHLTMSDLHKIGGRLMTASEIVGFKKALADARSAGQPQRTSNGTGLPGGFGFVETASPPGPYSGVKDQFSAYAVNIPPPNGFQLASNGSVAQIYQIEDPPGGSCILPFVYYYNNGGGAPFNAYGYFDECAVPTFGVLIPIISANAFYTTYVTLATSSVPPHIGEVVLGPPAEPASCGVPGGWCLGVFNNGTSLYDIFDISVGASNVNGNFGGSFWIEEPEQTGQCVALPNLGLDDLNIQLANVTTFVPLAIAMPGGTFTGFNQPATNLQRCFIDDGTFSGLIYSINNGNTFPTGYYNGVGGQFIVTSHP